MAPRILICLVLALAANRPFAPEREHVFDTPAYKLTLQHPTDADEEPWRASVLDKRAGTMTVWSFKSSTTNWYGARIVGGRAVLLGKLAELTDIVTLLDLRARRERASWYADSPVISPDGRYVAYIGQKPTHGPDSGLPDELFVSPTGGTKPLREVPIFRVSRELKSERGAAPSAQEWINRDAGLLWTNRGRDLAFLVDRRAGTRLMVAKLARGPRAVRLLARDVDLGEGADRNALRVGTMKNAGHRRVAIELVDGKTRASRTLVVPLPRDGG
jgi:hypothetical protein